MTTTLVTDDFAEGKRPQTGSAVHNIVFGESRKHTDTLDAETIEVLVSAGVIILQKMVQHEAGVTNIYRSVEGTLV